VANLSGEYELLAKSDLFDAKFYLQANPDIANRNIDPLTHYLERGCHERRNPSANFDTSYYLRQCEALGELPPNALIHYLTVGVNRGLAPAPRKSSKRRNNGSAKPPTPTQEAEKAIEAHVVSRLEEAPFPGYVDIFGYSSAAGGWLFSGWVARPPSTNRLDPVDFIAQFEQSQNRGKATLAFYQRTDVDPKAIGVVAYLPSSSRAVGNLQEIAFNLEGISYTARCTHSAALHSEQELVDKVRPNLLTLAFENHNRTHLLSITSRRGFAGHETLSALSEPVLLEIDEAILCPPDGVLLKGWHLAATASVRSIRVRSGPLAGELQLSKSISIARPDVIESVGQELGFSNVRCGFIAHVPGTISHNDVAYIEVELANGEVGFKDFKLSKTSGIDAIRRILEGVDVRFGELDAAFDNVLGPAIRAINVARLQELAPVDPLEIQYGQTVKSSRCSLIIPLYGRIDFVEYQMAMFSRDRTIEAVDIIYVLDDPTKRRELEVMSLSVFERFRIPFRIILLPKNLGFAPANNIGLRAARGSFVCFLNSDIVPITENWLGRLIDRLAKHPDIGILGAQLLYEDGSIQHEGCVYRPLPEFGNWTFVDHLNKGRRPGPAREMQRCAAITGACMVMRRELATAIKGFDESFIIGDFEDSDLCLRAQHLGKACAVDHAVQLYHLERKSQAAPSQNWRLNLTLYNAWVHQRRWYDSSSLARAPGRATT
jgi:GT2 family glycosyltransferase